MQLVSLPKHSASKKDEKGQPALNTVNVTNTKAEGISAGVFDNGITVTIPENGKGVTYNIPAELFQYQKYDALAEFITDCGGEDKALVIVNDFKRDESCNAGKALLRTSTNKDTNALINSALSAVKSHSFEEAAKIDAKEFVAFGRNLQENLDKMSPEEVVAALKKQLGL